MIKLHKIQTQLQEQIDTTILRLLFHAAYYEYHNEFRGYIADVKRGRAHYNHNVFTVPLWVFKPDHPKNINSNGGYFIYYAAHKLSHLV